jgi:hypothetical protein
VYENYGDVLSGDNSTVKINNMMKYHDFLQEKNMTYGDFARYIIENNETDNILILKIKENRLSSEDYDKISDLISKLSI